MKKMTTGQIYRIFKNKDNDTLIRKTNIRSFCIKNNVDYIISQNICLVNLNDFMKHINPKHTNKLLAMPRLRTKISAQKDWNAHHRKKIKHFIIDKICDSGKVFVYKNGRYNVINYDELEKELIKELKKQNRY